MKVSILLVVGMIVALSVALIPPSAISDPACWLPGLNASCEFSVVSAGGSPLNSPSHHR